MNKQVITIHPGGAVSGLQVKPGKGLNLQSLGKAKTVRASEIAWDEDAQAWYVDVLQTPGKGAVTYTAVLDADADTDVDALAPSGWFILGEVMFFASYEDAVAVEIAYLNALRLRGEFPPV